MCRFFTKKVGYMPEEDPTLLYIKPAFATAVADIDEALDVDLAASGVNNIMCEHSGISRVCCQWALKRPIYMPDHMRARQGRYRYVLYLLT